MALGVALIVVDITIVNVILAPITEDLSIASSEAQWIQESYAITFATLLLVTGRLSDLYGARRILLLGLLVFGATSLLATLAPSGGLLIPARFAQGVGGAMILPTPPALLNATLAAAVGPLRTATAAEAAREAMAVGVQVSGYVCAGLLLLALAAMLFMSPGAGPKFRAEEEPSGRQEAPGRAR
ncbi:MFS transporter [Streptomyces sp. C11-1]|uniref:MFS transporter n=1 Tax=Streptomyces durocortorensis TaxID=2811104 RepID=A0ABY9W4Z7_9ACTN|nr:MFS transporter [Streptomyces durocortorensis]WNF31211.1 MFS transporter [Streptomyces durocortorensis]